MGFRIDQEVLETYVQEPGVGGGSRIGEIRFYVGHRIYAKKDHDIWGKSSFFPAASPGAEDISASLVAAKAKLAEIGEAGKKVPFAVAIVTPKNRVINRDTSKWKVEEEMWDIVDDWQRYQDEYAEGEYGGDQSQVRFVLGSLFEHMEEADYGNPTWAEIGFKQYRYLGGDGSTIKKGAFPYVIRRFANREEAVEAAGPNYVLNEAVWEIDEPEWFDEGAAGAPWPEYNKAIAQALQNGESVDSILETYGDILGSDSLNKVEETVRLLNDKVKDLPPF